MFKKNRAVEPMAQSPARSRVKDPGFSKLKQFQKGLSGEDDEDEENPEKSRESWQDVATPAAEYFIFENPRIEPTENTDVKVLGPRKSSLIDIDAIKMNADNGGERYVCVAPQIEEATCEDERDQQRGEEDQQQAMPPGPPCPPHESSSDPKTSDVYQTSGDLPWRFDNPAKWDYGNCVFNADEDLVGKYSGSTGGGRGRPGGERRPHPLFRTTNSEYGSKPPCVHTMPHTYHPTKNKYWDQEAGFGMYRNCGFNTGVDRKVV